MDKPYEIAVSYASEQRVYVESFVRCLKRKHIHVYYDRDEQVRMAGKLLHEQLQEIYTEECNFRIIFLSHDYAKKPTTKLESEFILAENMYEKNRMFVFRFDETNLPGLNRNFIYSTIDEYPSPEDYANFIYACYKKKP